MKLVKQQQSNSSRSSYSNISGEHHTLSSGLSPVLNMPAAPPSSSSIRNNFDDDQQQGLAAETNMIIVAASISLVCLVIAVWCFLCQFRTNVQTFTMERCCCCARWCRGSIADGPPTKSVSHSSIHTRRDSLTITNLPRFQHLKEGRKCSSSLFNDLICSHSIHHSLEPIKCDCKNYSLLGPHDHEKDNFRGRSLSHFIRSPKPASPVFPHTHDRCNRQGSLSPHADFKPRAFSLSRASLLANKPGQGQTHSAHCRTQYNHMLSPTGETPTPSSGDSLDNSNLPVIYQETVVSVPITDKVAKPVTEVRSASLRSNKQEKKTTTYQKIERNMI